MHNAPVIIAATGNKGKLIEISNILSVVGVKVISMKGVGIDESPEETGASFIENAFIKANFLYDKLKGKGFKNFIALADDSGLNVDALGGRPGIYSARYGGEELSDNERTKLLLDEMAGIPEDRRGAAFVCAIAAIMQDGSRLHSEGVLRGKIAFSPAGREGFGYDPVFIPEMSDGKTMAEFSQSEKNKISHRGIALNNLKEKLELKL